jgi:type IV secretory pathway VirB2 component (pilin)
MQSHLDGFHRNWLPVLALALVIAALFHPIAAYASSTGGSLPWDTPLTTLKNDITGPVAITISLLAMVACGAALVFGGEINENSYLTPKGRPRLELEDRNTSIGRLAHQWPPRRHARSA